MIDAELIVSTSSGDRRVRLSSYGSPAREERATNEAHAWIKALRHANVDGQPFRRRFHMRDDSLWWFTEIYLHKQQVVLGIFQALAALEALIEREDPVRLQLVSGGRIVGLLAPQVAYAHHIPYGPSREPAYYRSGPWPESRFQPRMVAMDARASWLNAAALASRLRPRSVSEAPHETRVAAFIHRAFWRADREDGSAEAYVGPVLSALERRLAPDRVQYVGIGPALNFAARRWWHPLRREGGPVAAPPIERFAPRDRLTPSRDIWRDRHANRQALWASDDLRRLAIIRGCDCWPLIREELAGVALLQWPWSARVMDEAAAALDGLKPGVVVTYAEAGGWGRALMLECRRRGIPGVGLQHGFIYRHWLNYVHEPDEMLPDPGNPSDTGFPRPALTLLFDEYAANHLVTAGHFPRESLMVTGSPRLDDLVAAASRLSQADIDTARVAAGAAPQDALVLIVTKHKEARWVLPAVIDAASVLPHVHLAIKTHPAETPDVYRDAAHNRPHVTVLPAAAPLAPLLRASRAVVTVNSTVALDAAVLGVPALVVGLPNNLSPFVDAGVMVGAPESDLTGALRRILYDEELLQQTARLRREFLTRFAIASDGRAAARAAEAVLDAAHSAEGC